MTRSGGSIGRAGGGEYFYLGLLQSLSNEPPGQPGMVFSLLLNSIFICVDIPSLGRLGQSAWLSLLVSSCATRELPPHLPILAF